MAFEVPVLIKKMLTAAMSILEDDWALAEIYVNTEFIKIIESIKLIKKLYTSGRITKEQAKLHFQIQQNATRMVLLTIEGLSIITVETIINASLDAIQDEVDNALGWNLISPSSHVEPTKPWSRI